MNKASINTDKEIWREIPDDYYSPSIHVTKDNRIGINVGGYVVEKTAGEWFNSAQSETIKDKELIEKIAKLIGDAYGHSGHPKWDDDIRHIAESINKLYLEAGYVQKWKGCPDCYNGKEATIDWDDDGKEIKGWAKCQTCNGTGKVLQYAELAEDQSLPENPFNPKLSELNLIRNDIYTQSQQDMLTPHKEGERMVAYRKVLL